MEEDVMRRKILVFIAVLVIPILILLADHFILNHYLHSEPTKNLKILILSGF